MRSRFHPKIKYLIRLLASAATLFLMFFWIVPAWFDNRVNDVVPAQTTPAGVEARRLHESLIVADMHADTLLWDRDLLERGRRGHVDVPRLIEGHVALQVFTTVTQVPNILRLNMDRNEGNSDAISLLAVAERWPTSTWTSLRERALYQGQKLRKAAAASDGQLKIVRTAQDLDDLLEQRASGAHMVGALLGFEGAQALEGTLSGLDTLFDADFRLVGLAHFFDNEAAGSAHGAGKYGLTALGKDVVRHAESKGMVIDLAHASEATIDDVLAMATRPVVVSHTGVKATHPGARNLSDDQILGVAATGGVVCIGFWKTAVGELSPEAIVRAIRHVSTLAGVDHVGLGSDFDGCVATPFDASGMNQLIQALLDDGFAEGEIRAIMGENVVRVLHEWLPDGAQAK